MQFVLRVDGLGCGHQVLSESVTQVNIDFIETALVVTESGEVLIDVLPLAVFLVRLLLEIGKEVAFHLFLVEKIVTLVYDTLIASAAQCLGFLRHALVIVLLALVPGLGKDVDAK